MMYRVEDCEGPIPFGIEVYERKRPPLRRRVVAALQWVLYGALATLLGGAILAAMVLFPVPAAAGELGLQWGESNWSRCSGKACWDQSGDPRFPLPVTWHTRDQTIAAVARESELEVSLHWSGMRNAVAGKFVDDKHFDADKRRVVGCPERVIDAAVDQWQLGLRAVWAPRWRLAEGLDGQLEAGIYGHHTRWAINWRNQGGARGDGGDWSLTPTGGAKLVFTGPARVIVTAGVEAYHRPTVQTAPLGGAGRKGPGRIDAVIGVRWSL